MLTVSQSRASTLFLRLSPDQQTLAFTHEGLWHIALKSRLDAHLIEEHVAFTSDAMRQLCRQIPPESQQIPIIEWFDIDMLTGTVPEAPGPYRG